MDNVWTNVKSPNFAYSQNTDLLSAKPRCSSKIHETSGVLPYRKAFPDALLHSLRWQRPKKMTTAMMKSTRSPTKGDEAGYVLLDTRSPPRSCKGPARHDTCGGRTMDSVPLAPASATAGSRVCGGSEICNGKSCSLAAPHESTQVLPVPLRGSCHAYYMRRSRLGNLSGAY